jgi:hypothetical protein
MTNRWWAGTRRVATALLVLAALGGMLDRGQIDSSALGGRPGLTEFSAASGGRFRDPVALGREWPGADIVMDAGCTPQTLLRYRALAEPRSIAVAELPALPAVDRSPTRAGEWRNHRWVIHTDTDPTTRADDLLLVWCQGGSFTLVQSRLVEGLDDVVLQSGEEDQWVTWLSSPPRRTVTDITADVVVLVGLMLLGGVLLPAGRGPVRPALALLVGMGLWGVLGLLLLSTAVTMLLAIAAALAIRRATQAVGTDRVAFGWSRGDLPWAAAFVLLIILVVARVRTDGWHLLHTDSMAFLLGGWAFASGSMDPTILIPKRGLVLQALHGPGFLLRVEGLQSLAAVTHVTGAWLLLMTLASRLRRLPGARVSVIAAATLLLVSPFLVRSSALINSHLLVGALLLAVVLLWESAVERQDDGDLRRTVVSASVLGGAVVLLRPEGILVVALLLLGTLWSGARWRAWTPVWRLVGGASILWGGLLALGAARSGLSVGLDRSSAVLLGALVMLAPELLRRLPEAALRRLPPVVLGVLWTLALTVVAVRDGRVRFFTAARENVLVGRGGWGVLWVTVLMLVLVGLARALGTDRARTLGPAMTLVIGFAPLTMFVKMLDNVRTFDLARMLSGGGRVGYFDSVNRMWIHVLLVALYLGISQAVTGPARPGARTQRRIRAAITIRALGVATIALVLARLWAPAYVEAAPLRGEAVSRLISVITVSGTDVVGELVDGTRVEQEVLLDDRIRPTPDARLQQVCVDIVFVTFARVNAGEVRIALAHGTRSAATAFASADLEDWGDVRSCLDLPADPDLAIPFRITVTGHGGTPGASPSLLRTTGSILDEGVVVPPATWAAGDRAVVTTLRGPIGLELSVTTVEQSGPALRPYLRTRTLLALPGLMALLVVAIVAVDARSLRRTGLLARL